MMASETAFKNKQSDHFLAKSMAGNNDLNINTTAMQAASGMTDHN